MHALYTSFVGLVLCCVRVMQLREQQPETHFFLQQGAEQHGFQGFTYAPTTRPDRALVVTQHSDDVTALCFMKEIRVLAVGYKFGGVQLWSLSNNDTADEDAGAWQPSDGYRHTVKRREPKAVTCFAYQQAAEDTTMKYIWIGFSEQSGDVNRSEAAEVRLYVMSGASDRFTPYKVGSSVGELCWCCVLSARNPCRCCERCVTKGSARAATSTGHRPPATLRRVVCIKCSGAAWLPCPALRASSSSLC